MSSRQGSDTRMISIIIPCLNEGQGLQRCLSDLQAMRSAGHELILVDGGSRERGLIAKLEPYVDRLLYASPGRAQQMNSGAMHASGDVYWFLHADSRIRDGMDCEILAAVGSKPSWGRFDIRLSGSHPLFRIIERMMNWRSRISGIATGDQGIFVHCRLFEQVGGFPLQPLMEDIEISRRLKRLTLPVCLHGHLVTSSRRWESKGIVRTMLLMWMLRFAYWVGVKPKHLARLYTLAPG
ncbi:MAG: TIGR04283 family arsenosugar biosynthesis glycosyltransferase [Candidatus Thiodiazotropha taylori]|nr:TIGR04283 family arsenosugar biosynthesis glycosyltransferase [Candidatus Thiodiazotropha taylori]MCW4223692.1 TIGR04283 family arsenosugar biosynthesis glycosyltransferase [Candidatus Thiodiazotropha endolucinida]MCG7883110.1 TIGR04283 family arsenosugar biosynthesis glycosyltransferase [Candidatus Thiodiazotropha taylori]MCG7885269.1 TIGR04283 family arsenosugar biosynthesis glycosyltransferase [Candidatus Thiodiazotropha taylori]MCG7891016.1 TIGR04283 family arsenosugar biosynthesis glyco